MIPLQRLLARHMRLHRDLLELWRVTSDAPFSIGPSQMGEWLARRETLLGSLILHDAPALAAQSRAACDCAPDHPLVPHLTQLYRQEVRIMETVLRLGDRVRAAGEAQLGTMERAARAAREARDAARSYAARGPRAAPQRGQARRSKWPGDAGSTSSPPS